MLAAKKKPQPAPCLEVMTEKTHDSINALALTVMSYLHKTVTLGENCYWVPENLIGKDGKTAILFQPSTTGNYRFDGWEPWHDGMFGGRVESLDSALAWVKRAREVRAGTEEDFGPSRRRC